MINPQDSETSASIEQKAKQYVADAEIYYKSKITTGLPIWLPIPSNVGLAFIAGYRERDRETVACPACGEEFGRDDASRVRHELRDKLTALEATNKELVEVIQKTLQQCGSLHKPIYFIWLREALKKAGVSE